MTATNTPQQDGPGAEMDSKTKMKAVMWEGKPYKMAVREVDRPKIEQEEDAIVRLTTAAICGTDLHIYHGVFGSSKPPWQMGHEGVGVVVEVGESTEHFKVGDRVLVPSAADLGFFSVKEGPKSQVPFYGFGADLGLNGGTQAEYLRVPFADHSLVAIPDHASDLDYLFLTDIFVTGWTGLDYARFKPGDSVAIFGAGPVGLMCAYSAMLRGASRVYSIDHVRQRLDKAASIGAVPIDFTSKDGTASEQILKREKDGVDRTVDCIGQECVNHHLKPQQNYVIQEAIKVTKINCGIGLIGVYYAQDNAPGRPRAETMHKELDISIPDVWGKGLSIGSGSVGPWLYKGLPKAFELVKSGRAKLGWIVTSEVEIDKAPEAYKRFDKKEEVKVVIRFPWKKDESMSGALQRGG